MKFCPQCHLMLLTADCDGISVLVCGSCGGCWFPKNSLDEAIISHPTALADLDSRYLGGSGFENYAGLTAYCPECRNKPLEEWAAPGVSTPLLECPTCEGVWVRSGQRQPLADSRQPTDEAGASLETEVVPSPADSAEPMMDAFENEAGEEISEPELPEGEPEGAEVSSIEKQDYLVANERYISCFIHGHLPRIPARKLAIVTCMDARMQVYEILGLKPGDANVIRNAGGIVTEDVLRSLIVSHHLLGTREFLIINHTDCGLLAIEEESFRDRLTDESGSAAIVPAVFHAFKDLEKNVRTQVLKVRSHPWLPKEITVRGFVYDVRTGRLNEVE